MRLDYEPIFNRTDWNCALCLGTERSSCWMGWRKYQNTPTKLRPLLWGVAGDKKRCSKRILCNSCLDRIKNVTSSRAKRIMGDHWMGHYIYDARRCECGRHEFPTTSNINELRPFYKIKFTSQAWNGGIRFGSGSLEIAENLTPVGEEILARVALVYITECVRENIKHGNARKRRRWRKPLINSYHSFSIRHERACERLMAVRDRMEGRKKNRTPRQDYDADYEADAKARLARGVTWDGRGQRIRKGRLLWTA